MLIGQGSNGQMNSERSNVLQAKDWIYCNDYCETWRI